VREIITKYKWQKLASRICNEHLSLTVKKGSMIFKCVKDSNRQFTTEETHTDNRHVRRHSTLLIIRKIFIKTITRSLYLPIRMATSLKAISTKCVCGVIRISIYHWWEFKVAQSLGK
jgi:hypothetical protein